MSRTVIVAGVGMIPFTKPGASKPYDEMGAAATTLALRDAGLEYGQVQQAAVGYVFGESTSGQAALYRVGLSGIPVFNINNNCSTGSSALFLARQMVASGTVECALALGFEQMQAVRSRRLGGPRVAVPALRCVVRRNQPTSGGAPGIALLRRCGQGIHGYLQHRAGAVRQGPREGQPACRAQSVRVVPQSGDRRGGVAISCRLPCRGPDAPDGLAPTCGAAAAILVSGEFARKYGLDARVSIAAQAMTTDTAAVSATAA